MSHFSLKGSLAKESFISLLTHLKDAKMLKRTQKVWVASQQISGKTWGWEPTAEPY